MKKIYLLLSLGLALLLTSCNNDLQESTSSLNVDNGKLINKSGASDGVKYSLNNVEVNPNVVSISSENARITSTKSEMDNGKFSFETTSEEVKQNLIIGTILYLKSGADVYLRTITAITPNSTSYTVETSEAYIGDLFSSGSLELSVDTKQAEDAIKSKSNRLIATTTKEDYNKSITFNIFEFIKEVKIGGFTLNPDTSVTTTLSIKLGFGTSRMLPNEVEFYYLIDTAIKPEFLFEGAVNKKFNHDLVQNIPQNLIDLIKKIELDITIPTGSFLGDLPAKVSINDINFPMEVEANISKNSHFALNASGTLKVGFAYYQGIPGKTSHFIYENSITSKGLVNADLTGEVISDMKISIKPRVKLVNADLVDVSGNVNFGINTFSVGNGNPATIASKGNFYSNGTFYFGTLGITLYTTELFKNDKELWNIGKFNTSMSFSNFNARKTSIIPCSGLNAFNYDITLGYKYPISGKLLSGNLEMSYDVYADNGSFMERKTITIYPRDVNSNNFKYNLCIPFRRINIFTIASVSYIKNITFKDANGYIANGIMDPSGQPYTQIKINR